MNGNPRTNLAKSSKHRNRTETGLRGDPDKYTNGAKKAAKNGYDGVNTA